MSCYIENSMKIIPASLRKELSNQHPNLTRFWSQLGLILGGFWGPRWGQVAPNRSKSPSSNRSKNDHISDRSWGRFWSILGPKMTPERGHQKSLFEVPGALEAILGPRRPQDLPKRALGPIFDQFWLIFQQILMDFRTNFD